RFVVLLMYAMRDRLLGALRLIDSSDGRQEDICLELERQIETLDKRWDLERRLNERQKHAHPWEALPEIYASYAESRILLNRIDSKTKQILELVKDAFKECNDITNPTIWFSITIPIHLAHVLQRLGVDPEKQKPYTDIAVKYLRPRRHLRARLAKFLERPNEPPHPVSLALGKGWFEERLLTDREIEKSYRRCSKCGDQGPQVKLSLCSQCKQVFYCSKQCQKAHWPEHKGFCRGIIKYKADAEQHGTLESSAASIMTDFRRWTQNFGHYANHEALLFSMKLHEDPDRGRTHVVVRMLQH
ncbi:hypothetical protein EIP91_008701, partial [Steccherinum ochraceum]